MPSNQRTAKKLESRHGEPGVLPAIVVLPAVVTVVWLFAQQPAWRPLVVGLLLPAVVLLALVFAGASRLMVLGTALLFPLAWLAIVVPSFRSLFVVAASLGALMVGLAVV